MFAVGVRVLVLSRLTNGPGKDKLIADFDTGLAITLLLLVIIMWFLHTIGRFRAARLRTAAILARPPVPTGVAD